MPQEFQVLQCYGCQTFQVHQVKKTTKWACKMCGEKQSLKKVFGRGTGADCRQHVQRLNTMRGEVDKTASNLHAQSYQAEPDYQTTDGGLHMNLDMDNPRIHNQDRHINQTTKWNAFVESNHSENNNDDDDEDDRYTTDASKVKQGRKRKRESKGGYYSRTGNTKWTEFSTAANTEYYGGCADSDGDRRIYETPRPLSEFPSQWKQRKSTKNKSEIYIEESSQRRKRWSTFEPDYLSSQESKFDEILAKRIEPETNLSRNMIGVKQNGDWKKKFGTQNNTKWGTFTESDVSSQESQEDHFQESDEMSYDSRPYVTFDPQKIDSSSFDTALSQENENDSRHVSHNENNVGYYRESTDNSMSSVESSNYLPKKSTSKWTGFLACKEVPNQSEQDVLHTVRTGKESSNDLRYADSNWAVFTGENLSSRGKQDENSHFSVSLNTKADKLLLNDMVLVQTQNEKIQSSERSRFLRNIGNQGNMDSLKNSENVKPLFTTGDLDDTDFEL